MVDELDEDDRARMIVELQDEVDLYTEIVERLERWQTKVVEEGEYLLKFLRERVEVEMMEQSALLSDTDNVLDADDRTLAARELDNVKGEMMSLAGDLERELDWGP